MELVLVEMHGVASVPQGCNLQCPESIIFHSTVGDGSRSVSEERVVYLDLEMLQPFLPLLCALERIGGFTFLYFSR